MVTVIARHKLLSQAAREKSVRCFDYPIVARQHLDIYRKAIGQYGFNTVPHI